MSEAVIRRPAIGPWTALLAFVVLWTTILAIGPVIRSFIPPIATTATPREIVGFRLIFGLPFTWMALGGTLLLLRWRGQNLSDIGWRRPAAIWGWITGFAVVAFFLWGSFRSPSCRGLCFIDPGLWLTDWSLFRLASSIAIGITAGLCEELSFRGFVMTQARAGGAPLPVQVLLSGITFGLAHIGNAGLSGRFDLHAAIGIVSSTTVFGIVSGVVYVLGRRSLTPVIVAHGLFAFTTEPWMLLWGLGQALHGH